MIFGFGDNAWIKKDVNCKVSRNGSWIQINYEEMGVKKCILIPERYMKQINDFKDHGDSFDTFCEISEPANRYTLDEEEKTRREYFEAQLKAR
jgi:hypothetical protein